MSEPRDNKSPVASAQPVTKAAAAGHTDIALYQFMPYGAPELL